MLSAAKSTGLDPDNELIRGTAGVVYLGKSYQPLLHETSDE